MTSSLFPSFHSTMGAASIGFSLSCGVFGILTTLVFIYYQRFPHDKLVYKILVALLWVLELVDQIFIGYSIYYYTITHYGDPAVLYLEDIIWPFLAQVIVGNLVGTIVKCCFALRVWRFSHQNVYITGPILALILGQTGCAVAYCVRGFQLNSLLFVSKLRVVASVALGSGMATDTFIALALCLLLHRLRTGFKTSDSIINTLIIYAVNTGALTGLVSFLTLLVYNVYPSAFYFMTFYFTLGKLYAISFLCTLNTRRSVRGKGTDHQEEPSAVTSGPRAGLFIVHSPTTSRSNKPPSAYVANQMGLEIGVHQEVSVLSDIERQGRIKFDSRR